MSFGREADSKQETPKENTKNVEKAKKKSLKHQKRLINDRKRLTFAKNRQKPRKKVQFSEQSESKQEKPKENSKKH